ncbi:MAG TPA: aldolase/citrate lyase family protein [Candidatus Thermoplasmatota archaeon]
MDIPPNLFKRARRGGRPQIGLWCSLGSATVAEILGHAGFDWVLIDTEHAPNELPSVVEQLRALSGGSTSALVRPAWNDPVLLKRLLDVGAQTVLVPFVQNAEEAKRAVAATRYPPEGIRGVASLHRANAYGRNPAYFQQAHEEMCVLVQLESRAAVGALEAIAAVPGVDGVFIGPSDLASSLGHLGNPRHPDVQTAIAEACGRARKVGKPIGILAPLEDDARRFLEMGFGYVAVGSDLGVLRQGVDRLRGAFPTTEANETAETRVRTWRVRPGPGPRDTGTK